MASKLRAKILAAKDIKSETVHIEEWDATVEVRGLTGAQLVAILDASKVKDVDGDGQPTERTDTNALTQAMILATTYDPETGGLVFEPTDADGLYQKSGNALNKIAKVALRMNGMNEEKAIEKNSGATVTGAGASA